MSGYCSSCGQTGGCDCKAGDAIGANGQAVKLLNIGSRPPVEVDVGIADLVQVLNDNGYTTRASCSGHGERPANIALADGREIIIARDWDEARRIERIASPATRADENAEALSAANIEAMLVDAYERGWREGIETLIEDYPDAEALHMDAMYEGRNTFICEAETQSTIERLVSHPRADEDAEALEEIVQDAVSSVMRAYPFETLDGPESLQRRLTLCARQAVDLANRLSNEERLREALTYAAETTTDKHTSRKAFEALSDASSPAEHSPVCPDCGQRGNCSWFCGQNAEHDEVTEAIARMMSEFVDNWPNPKRLDTALALVAKTIRTLLEPPKHVYWGAGEPDCPRDIKASNGEIHTLRCKVCGNEDARDDRCLASAMSQRNTSGQGE